MTSPMSEGHERPEPTITVELGHYRMLWTGLLTCAVIVTCFAFRVVHLQEQNTALRARLDWWECKQPEQPGSPTLIEDEPRPLTDDEFDELQKRLKGEQVVEGTTLADHPSIEQELSAAMPVVAAGVYGSPVQDLRAEYAADYRRGQKVKHAECDHCEACGITEAEAEEQGGQLNDHHVISVKRIFEEGLPKSLIGDPKNLIRLCRNCGGECHLRLGHDPDGDGPLPPKWSESNPNVRRDAAKALSKTTQAP